MRLGSRREFLGHCAALPVLALGPAACGFHARGVTDLPFETLYAGFTSASEVGREFRHQIAIVSKTRLVERPQDAQGRLTIITDVREKEITAFSSTGLPVQYELRLRFSFRLTDAQEREWLPRTDLLLHRLLNIASDNLVVAKELEEGVLYRDMTHDLVRQLLRRLSVARPPVELRER